MVLLRVLLLNLPSEPSIEPFPFVGLGGNLGYWQFGALLLGPSRGRVGLGGNLGYWQFGALLLGPSWGRVGLGGKLGYWQFGALLLGPSRGRVPPQPLCPTQSPSWQELGGFEPQTAIYQARPCFKGIVCGSGPETSTPEAGKYLKTRLFKKIVAYPRSAWPKSASNGRSGPKRAE